MLFARPLPIVIAIQSFHPGGTERQMIELARRLDRSRWEVHVACFSTDGAWRDQLASTPVTDFPIAGFLRRSTLQQARRFSEWCRERSIALVHTSDFYTNTFFLPAAAFAGVPARIGSRREIVADKRAAQLAVQRLAYSAAHLIVANAKAGATRLRREGVSPRRIAVVPNGLDVERFTEVRPMRPLRRIAMVANLRPRKGQDVMLAAMPRILARHPKVHLSLIGDGPMRGALVHQVRGMGIAHAVSFAGHAENVAKALADADIFALPSYSEAFPNALLEAMAAGLPAVATSVGGVPEVLEDGRTGLSVPPGNPAALADALLRLLDAPDLARTLGAAAQAAARERFSFERMVAAFEHLYLTTLARQIPERTVQSQVASL